VKGKGCELRVVGNERTKRRLSIDRKCRFDRSTGEQMNDGEGVKIAKREVCQNHSSS
jgi:hypothetical protein